LVIRFEVDCCDCEKWECKLTTDICKPVCADVSVNQSIFIYIGQPEPILARPVHIKRKHTQHYTNITTETDEKIKKLSRYWNETSAAKVHTYFFSTISSNRGKANSLNIVVTTCNLLYI